MFHASSEWMQCGLDAMEAMFATDDATRREMIQFLFDEGFWDKDSLTWAGAMARFNDCLNPNKPRFFKQCELWALMKRFRRYDLLHAMVEDLGFFPLREKPTEQRRQDLLARIAEAQERLLAVLAVDGAALATLDDPGKLRMHPAVREGRAAFSQRDAAADADDEKPGLRGGF